MIEFIDKTTEQNGTPLNRNNLMGIQGFEALTTTISYNDGVLQVAEKNSDNQIKTTTFNNYHSIIENFVGDKTITKTTQFTNGKIIEVIT